MGATYAYGAGTVHPSEAPAFTPAFSGIRVTRSFVFCVMFFFYRCLSFCPFSFGHCVVCPSLISDFPFCNFKLVLAILEN
jgi:hypothetical protein